MLIVLLSDIHSNAVAIETVLADLPAHDALWCLGDTIGYGPQPNECIARMTEVATLALTGNHDLACLGEVSLVDFNPVARTANLWNNEQLEPARRKWLLALPARIDQPTATLAHASPRDPIWEYILDVATARANLESFATPICFVGHSHVPLVYERQADGKQTFHHLDDGDQIQLKPDARYIFNPGSVGQPRDGDPRAAYGLWDTEAATFQLRRVGYDIAATQRLMHAVGLPQVLADRLAVGH